MPAPRHEQDEQHDEDALRDLGHTGDHQPYPDPIVTQRPQKRARARARRRLVRRRGPAALCWMGFALGALSGRQARDQPRRGEEAHGVGGDDRAQIARGEQQATQRAAHQAPNPLLSAIRELAPTSRSSSAGVTRRV